MKKCITIIRLISAGVFLLLSMPILAQTFKASHLQKAYEKLRLSEYKSDNIAIRKASDGTIEHIGIPLFSTEMRTLLPSPIYDYLEYALLDYKYHINDNTLQQQKIRFRHGSWEDLEKITPADDCSIDNRDDKWYIVRWSHNSQEILSVAVPIDYELLSNSTRKEMEQNFSRDLKRFKLGKIQPVIVEADELESLHRDGLLVKKGELFLMPEINNDTYYRYEIQKESAETTIRPNHSENITFEEEVPVLLIDRDYPQETLANILLIPDHGGVNVSLSLELLFAGYHKETVRPSLPQWMGYCQSVGCTPYYIYEGAKGDQGAAILMMYNRSEGYAHLAYLHNSISQLENKIQSYSGKVYMYIPTSNISELFAKVAVGKSTPKSYK